MQIKIEKGRESSRCRVKSTQEFNLIEVTREEIVVGLDIGTTKVGTVIAAGDAEGALRIIGVGSTPSRGIKRGVVVDVEETVAAIQHSVERAAHMAGVKVEGVIVGVTGDHIESSNRHAAVTVAGGQGAISRDDVRRVLQAAALEVPRDREIIHSLPRSFTVDGHGGVRRPIGMTAQKLEVETHIVTGKAPYLQNAVQCVERAGLKVEALVLEPIATAAAVTTVDEREMGVILIDIGGGTSDIAVFHDGSIVYSGVLPVGGNHVTRDIAIGLRTPFEVAEDLKIDSGAATREMIPHGEALEITMAGTTERLRIPRAILGEIIEARMSELFELAREMMHRSGARKRLPGGVILSGGGALLPGAIELANSVFAMPVRLGYPYDVTGWSDQVASPQLATGVGLCRFALTQRQLPGNQAIIPPIAALEGRRIWGAVATADDIAVKAVASPPDNQEKAAPKSEPLIDAGPDIMDVPSQVSPAEAKAEAESGDNEANPENRAAEIPATAAPMLTVAESPAPPAVSQLAANTAVIAPAHEAPTESQSPATPPRSAEFEAPRFEARPTPARAESVRTDSARPADAARDSGTTRDSGAARTDARPVNRPSGSGNSSSNSAATGTAQRRSPVRPDGQTRVRSGSNAMNGNEDNDVFRRSDTPIRQKSRVRPPVKESWWDKLKHFLGFEKVDD